ncbi:MAG: hypothetical protein IJR14_04440 [Synergistaceae bacterium]|nr:hypothetical protein [Synergistaceae bacterium]
MTERNTGAIATTEGVVIATFTRDTIHEDAATETVASVRFEPGKTYRDSSDFYYQCIKRTPKTVTVYDRTIGREKRYRTNISSDGVEYFFPNGINGMVTVHADKTV